MHRAKRAIIMAAGLGNRMRPLTLETPKPLVMVNGKRMIDTVIDGLHEQGITEIYIVIGHLKERFYELQESYPDVVLIENPYFDQCNNISSLYVAREQLSDVIILDGDQMIYDSEILRPEFEHSGYCCSWTEEQTDEWLMQVENGIVTSCSRNGGKKGYQLYSVSLWSAEDGARLRNHLEQEFEVKRNRDIYWDAVAMFCYPGEYQLGIREIPKGALTEIDSLEELAAIDQSYQKYLEKRSEDE